MGAIVSLRELALPAPFAYPFLMSIAEIQNLVSDLSEFERGTLAAWLLNSLPPHSSEDASAECLQEAARRRDELDSGQVLPLSSDDFWASIERLRATWK